MKQIRTTLVELAVDKDTPEPRIKMAVDLIQSGVTKAVPAQGFIGVKDPWSSWAESAESTCGTCGIWGCRPTW